MLSGIWSVFMILGILTACWLGRVDLVTGAIIDGGKDAVSLALTMAGVVATWSGIMRIAEKSGMIPALAKRCNPLLDFLFPDLPQNHKAREYIATNFVANFLGLGWAAMPAGLMAMKELQILNKEKEVASKTMCMFLIINMSSLQLVTVNILAYRTECGSANPTEIIGGGIIATLVSTVAAVFIGKIIERRHEKE